MADEKPPPEFINALGTEYFVLQSTASSTISESGSRVSIYLSSLASGLVALGFSSASPRAFASLAFTVLPTVFVLGWFTIVRLIDTSVANLVSLRRMELIRAYYAALAPMAPPYFGVGNPATGEHGVRYGRWSFLFTMAHPGRPQLVRRDRHDRRQPRSHLTGPEQAMTVWDKAARPARLPDRPYPSSLPEKQHSGKSLSQGDTLERHGR